MKASVGEITIRARIEVTTQKKRIAYSDAHNGVVGGVGKFAGKGAAIGAVSV
jgi:hypothetical protein